MSTMGYQLPLKCLDKHHPPIQTTTKGKKKGLSYTVQTRKALYQRSTVTRQPMSQKTMVRHLNVGEAMRVAQEKAGATCSAKQFANNPKNVKTFDGFVCLFVQNQD